MYIPTGDPALAWTSGIQAEGWTPELIPASQVDASFPAVLDNVSYYLLANPSKVKRAGLSYDPSADFGYYYSNNGTRFWNGIHAIGSIFYNATAYHVRAPVAAG